MTGPTSSDNQEPVLPHLTSPGELGNTGHPVLDQFLQNVPRMNIHCQQRPQSLPANIVLSHYINDLDIVVGLHCFN